MSVPVRKTRVLANGKEVNASVPSSSSDPVTILIIAQAGRDADAFFRRGVELEREHGARALRSFLIDEHFRLTGEWPSRKCPSDLLLARIHYRKLLDGYAAAGVVPSQKILSRAAASLRDDWRGFDPPMVEMSQLLSLGDPAVAKKIKTPAANAGTSPAPEGPAEIVKKTKRVDVLGQSLSSIARKLGNMGYSIHQAEKCIAAQGVDVAAYHSTIATGVSDGRSEKYSQLLKIAELDTATQAKLIAPVRGETPEGSLRGKGTGPKAPKKGAKVLPTALTPAAPKKRALKKIVQSD